jgi:starch synthase
LRWLWETSSSPRPAGYVGIARLNVDIIESYESSLVRLLANLRDGAADDRQVECMKSVRVLSVASEIYPLIKTGGLADVTGALPIALKPEDIEVRTLVPGYPSVMNSLGPVEGVLHLPDFFGGEARLLRAKSRELGLFVLDAPHLFARAGNPYLKPDGADWPDNALRFAALARIAADIGLGVVPSFVPDIVHAHDWQAALALAYLHYSNRRRPATVMTVHNLAYQGVFPREMLAAIGLPPESFTIHGVEYYGKIGFLKAGLYFADRITTVSPTYAREILSDEGGMGLGGLLRERSCDLSGILNGIDTSVWDPATDPHIPGCFYADMPDCFESDVLKNRATNKAALQRRLGLQPAPDAFLLGVIGRLSRQKGLDLLLEYLPRIVSEGMQLAVLGSSGDRGLQYCYRAAAQAHPERVSVSIGHDEGLAHLIQAGVDALVVPSRFEPCGLTPLCALRYGTVPIVSRVGGLEDTVVDALDLAVTGGRQTGFKFGPVTAENLAGVLQRACAAFHDVAAWRRIQRNGMSTDVSWHNSTSRYANLYRSLIELPEEKVA